MHWDLFQGRSKSHCQTLLTPMKQMIALRKYACPTLLARLYSALPISRHRAPGVDMLAFSRAGTERSFLDGLGVLGRLQAYSEDR